MTALATHDDRALLQRYARTGDAEAFTELVQRYIVLVYGVCLRVTGNRTDAEDVTQECLLDLARNASRIHSSIGGYLHTVATRRSLMLRRSEGRRTRREAAYVPTSTAPDPATAAQVTDAVDEALQQLDEESRDLIIRRYLQGQNQQAIAAALGVDQSGVSRKLAQAIEAMRQHLGTLGMAAGSMELAEILGPAQPPAELIATVTKIGLSGVGRAAARAALPAATRVLIATVAVAAAVAIGYGVLSGKGRTAMVTTATANPAAAVRPNLQGIHLSGFGMTRDSVSVAFQAAAKALGKDADYEHLYVLSGNAFAPAINTGETCRSWWHVQARLGTRNLPAMAASVGLAAEPIAVPAIPDNASEDQLLAIARTIATQVPKAMDSGAIGITEGGWDEAGAWVWSGVVTDVAADGALRGAAMSAATGDGKENVLWKYPSTLWAVRPATTTTTPASNDRLILATAIDRIRGTGPYAARGTDYFGLAAMDQWIGSMRDIRGFCPDCFKRSPVVGVQDAPDNDKRMCEAAKVVARQLRTGLAALPGTATPHLEQAASCYDRIAQLLEPGATGKGGFTWDSLSSIEAQRDYVKDVLDPVRTELDWAAAHLERALAVCDGARLNTTFFPAYDQLTRENPDPNPLRTNHLARVIAAHALGRSDVDYDDLVMLEGIGTIFAYHPKQYSLMYQPPDAPWLTAPRLVEGTGFDWVSEGTKSPEEAWDLIKRCVDTGTPLVNSWLDDFFIAGYQDAPIAKDRRIYTMGKWSLALWMTWDEFAQHCQRFGAFAHPTGAAIAKKDLTRSILERIVQYAAADGRATVDFMKAGKFSFEGMEAYAADVEDMGKGPDYFDPSWLACHAINRQWHARESAAKWLIRAARNQPAPVAEPLQRAAALYGQSHDLWKQFRALLSPEPGQKLEDKWTESAPRQQGAQLIRQAIELERQAAVEIASALPHLSQ